LSTTVGPASGQPATASEGAKLASAKEPADPTVASPSLGVLAAKPPSAAVRPGKALPPLVPVPAFAPTGVTTAPLYRATMPANAAESGRVFFSENAVTMNSMVLVLPKQADYSNRDPPYNNDALTPRHIAQAALKANPQIQFIVPTTTPFTSAQDPRFADVRSDIARRLGVPESQVFPVRAKLSWFPQDEFLAGAALTKPLERTSIVDPRRTYFGVNQLARELGLPAAMAAGAGPGGDLNFVDRDGQQLAYFSDVTIASAAATHGLAITTPETRLQAIAITIKQVAEAGVPVGNIMPLGYPESGSTLTYGDVLQRMTPAAMSRIDPAVRAQLNAMRDLPFPQRSYAYHTDVAAFTPDGRQMFVRQRDLNQPALAPTLRFFGFEPLALPGGSLINPQDRALPALRERMKPFNVPMYYNPDLPANASTSLTYSNMVQGRLPDGRQVILMPTEALDPDRLTARDREVMALLQARVPSAVIVPIGGHSAIVGTAMPMPGGTQVLKDWGAHCMSNVLPYVVDFAPPLPR
jgi:hypothetical protein